MPTPRNSNRNIAGKGAGAKTPATVNPAPSEAAPAVDPGRSAVIAELVKSGMSYAQAVASLDGTANPAAQPAPKKIDVGRDPGADEVIDEDSIVDPGDNAQVVEITHTPPDGYKMIEHLYALRDDIGKSRKKRRFRFPVELDQRLFDWIVYATIAEATFRGRPDLTIEDFIEIKIKELKAADPTQGGRRDPSTSGPRDNYNPNTGRWNG